jgi:uncharacterized protein YbjT (DUF2867 family)
MKIKAIITGSTGMVGKGVLLECLQSSIVESVLVINRSPLGLSHTKIREIIHKDLFDLGPIKEELSGYNACFFCLGVTSAGMSENDYRHVTYDLTLNMARVLKEHNPDMIFCYISGAGTDTSEKGRIMWARVKGKTENDLLALGFKDAYMFRPGFIRPMKGVKSRTVLYNALYVVLKPLFPLIMCFPKFATTSEKLSKAMIMVASEGFGKKVLESSDINEIVGSRDKGQGTRDKRE